MAARRRSTTPLDDLFAHSDAVNARAQQAAEEEPADADDQEPAGDEDDQDEEDGQDEEGDGNDDARWAAQQLQLKRRGGQGAGAFLALFAYPLLLNLLDGGPSQMWGWVQAKFVNKPFGGASNSGPSTTAANPDNIQTVPLGREKV